MQESGFEDVEACVIRRKNAAIRYIVMLPILYLYEETVQITGIWVVNRWWEKEVMDLVGAWEVTSASEEEVGEKDMDREADGLAGN